MRANAPLEINATTFREYFIKSDQFEGIPREEVVLFICSDSLNCDINPDSFRYDYGIRVDFSKKYTTVLVRKLKFEGETVYDFDLSEIMFIAYDQEGNILTTKNLTKDNDGWISSMKISDASILVKQARIVDFQNEEMKCEIIETEYVFTDDGNLEILNLKPPIEGIVSWNEETQNFEIRNN